MTELETMISQVKHLNSLAVALDQSYTHGTADDVSAAEDEFLCCCQLTSNSLMLGLDELDMAADGITTVPVTDERADMTGIAAAAVDGKLLLRVPHPPKRTSVQFRGNQMMCNSVIANIADALELYRHKYVHIIHVFPAHWHGRGRSLDLDSYDLKAVLDEATRLYPGSDSAEYTKMTLQAMYTDAVPAMTYIVVDCVPAFVSQKDLEELERHLPDFQ